MSNAVKRHVAAVFPKERLTRRPDSLYRSIAELQEDLYHLRGNSITVEVNMARLFNHSVKLKKLKEAATTGKK